jgi:nondiscriminating glutamyl-tRNA synthetase
VSDFSSSEVRVRIAPSPTGAIHLGLARTTLFNWAFARHHGGKLVLRIEDTDRERSTAESEAQISDGLRWLGMDWDEGPEVGGPYGPYRQSERYERYEAAANTLLASAAAYRCFCSKERLSELRTAQEARKETPRYDGQCRALGADESADRAAAGEPFTIRFHVPEGETVVEDLVRGRVVFQNKEVDDWVMVRQGGNPTYNFVVVCDDRDMHITHVFRGEEHLVNTPKQILLYQALGEAPPQFGHLPLMLGKDGKKLSKRHGSVSLAPYREQGYSKEAILNFLARQGWSLDGETEIFSLETFVKAFEISDVNKAGSIFDFDKFGWMSGEYIHKESLAELGEHCAPYIIAAGLLTADAMAADPARFEAALALGQDRIRLYSEMPEQIGFFYCADDAVVYDEKAEANSRKHENRIEVLRNYLEFCAPTLEQWTGPEDLRNATKEWVQGHGFKFPVLFQPLRCALTGRPGGPDLFDIIDWLGPQAATTRILQGLQRLA